jgi:Cu+-exporting ATPase
MESQATHLADEFLVRPGERVVTDGVVLEGTSWLDEAMLTGESVAVHKGPGDTVYGATQNQAGSLVVRASSIGSDTAFGRIVLALERAQGAGRDARRRSSWPRTLTMDYRERHEALHVAPK